MVNTLKLAKYIISVILVISIIWIVLKKNQNTKTGNLEENLNNKISGFDRAMIKVSSIMEDLNPSSPITRQMTTQKNSIINHL